MRTRTPSQRRRELVAEQSDQLLDLLRRFRLRRGGEEEADQTIAVDVGRYRALIADHLVGREQ